jgi:long-chain acyl-CoA synthetase
MQLFSPYATLEGHASREPNAEAIVDGEVRITYAELFERISAMAGWLLHEGLTPGEVTGICVRDHVQHLVCAMALLCLGTPQMGLGAHEKGLTKRALARRIGVTQLIVEQPEEWMDGFRTLVLPRDHAAMSAAPKLAVTSAFGGCALDAIGLYLNTSGATNVPKTFGVSFGRLCANSRRYAEDPKERRALRTGSIEFDAHRLHRTYSLLAGNTCVFLHQLTIQNLIALCERVTVSVVHLGAYKLAALLREEPHNCRLPACTAILAVGSRIPGGLRQRLKASLTDNLWVLYATSEVGMISLASPDQHEAFPEGVGFPASDVTVEIVDPGGNVLGPGEIGEIRVRKAATISSGYVCDQGAASNFRDGWFYPGDLLSQSEGAPLIFHGRADDVMLLNNINVFPAAIEDTLESHPDVQEAVAYPIKSRIHGEIPAAAVVLSAKAQCRDAQHLLDYCRQTLGVRAPRQVLVVDRIPRNVAGKPLRRELAAL